MARYIDAEKFLKSMIAKFKCVPLVGVSKYIQGEECFKGEPLDSLINEAPTADVVEVVRCEKCKYCDHCYPAKAIDEEPVEGWYCNLNSKYVLPTHFCSYGERREE